MKKVVSSFLILSMLLCMLPTTVFAREVTSAGDAKVPVELTVTAATFSVTVPTVLPVNVDGTGTVTVATDNKIVNNSYGPVEVFNVSMLPQNGWSLVDFDSDFSSLKVGSKSFGFQINDSNVSTDGSCAVSFDVIPGNDEISFSYDAKIAPQTTEISQESIANVVFTMGWSSEGEGVHENDLNGKKLAVLGTSISMPEDTYVTTNYNEAIAEKYNMTLMNYAVGSSSVVKILQQYNQNKGELAGFGPDDFVIVEAGFNNHTLERGELTPEGTTTFNTSTLIGAMEQIVYQLEYGCEARFGVILTHFPATFSSDEHRQTTTATWDALASVCGKYGVPCLDLRDKDYSMKPDGIHLDDAGQLAMAADVEAWLKTL